MSRVAFTVLVGAIAIERLLELRLSRRNENIQRASGGVEYGSSHFPFMVALHAGLLAGCVVEVWYFDRPFIPALGWPMLGLIFLAAAGRFWVIATLGDRWTTRVIVVPGMQRIASGPYRYLRHPNYLVVVAEGFALPLVHTAWMTALAFSLANAVLLTIRIRIENRALGEVLGQ